MEELISSSPTINNSLSSSNNKNKNAKLLIIFLVFFLLISSFINFFFVLSKNQKISKTPQNQKISESQSENNSTISNWTKPNSNKKGYALTFYNGDKTPKMYIYSIDEGKLKPTNIDNSPGGFSYGFGVENPITSPDFLLTAYKTTDGNLWILSNETLEKKQVTKNGRISYLSGWSKDSKNFVYRVESEKPWEQGMEQRPTEIKKIPKTDPPGFYNLNLNTGEITYLFPLPNFITFIDNERILTTNDLSSNSDNKQTLEAFNVNTFDMDYTNENNYGFGVNQYQFDNTGKKWTFTLSRHLTDDANIIYADYPNKEGVTIDSAGWADIQHSIFSTDNKKIAYWKKDGNVSDGVPRYMVVVYDIDSKSNKVYAEGQVEAWIGPNQILYRSNGGDSSHDSKQFIVDITNSKITQIN